MMVATTMEAGSDSSTITATGWDKALNMNRGFYNTLITRVCTNRARDYEMFLYQLALQNDPHFSETVRRVQLGWIDDDKLPRLLERLRRANIRVNLGEKLPPWGPPLMERDAPPRELRRCRCSVTRDKVPWNSPLFWEGASTDLRNAMIKRVVRTGTPQAAITSKKPGPTRPSARSGAPGLSPDLSALVRTAAGSAERQERCTMLKKAEPSDEDICMFAHVPVQTRSNSCQTTDPPDLIHLVATNEAKPQQKRLFDYNVLHSARFRKEIYFQQKTYKLNEAGRLAQRLLAEFKRCIGNKHLPPTERAQLGVDAPNPRTPRVSATVSEAAAYREIVAHMGSVPGSSVSGRGQGRGSPAAPSRAPPAIKTARANEKAGFDSFRSPSRKSVSPGIKAKRRLFEDQIHSPHSYPSPIRGAAKANQQVAHQRVAHQNVAHQNVAHQNVAHQNVAHQNVAHQNVAQQKVDLLDLVSKNAATMAQLDVLEHRLKKEEGFQLEVVNRLRTYRQQSKVAETGRLLLTINRIAIWNLFNQGNVENVVSHFFHDLQTSSSCT
jgi:hypothetical protein